MRCFEARWPNTHALDFGKRAIETVDFHRITFVDNAFVLKSRFGLKADPLRAPVVGNQSITPTTIEYKSFQKIFAFGGTGFHFNCRHPALAVQGEVLGQCRAAAGKCRNQRRRLGEKELWVAQLTVP